MQGGEDSVTECMALRVRAVKGRAPRLAVVDISVRVREELFGRQGDALQRF